MAKKIQKSMPAKPMGSSIQPPSSKKTCLIFVFITLVILALFFIGAIISGIVLWKTYGPGLIEKLSKTVVSTVVPSTAPFFNGITLTPTPNPIQATEQRTTSVEEQTNGMDGEILPESNIRNVIRADFSGMTPWELKVARNEIYARHGRPFVHQDLACYFANTSWYRRDPNYTDSRLSTLEQRNAVFILNYEKEIGSPVWGVDTGCK
jgi:hypothetical protein